MSKIEVNAVEPQSGTTLTLGASGDTVALAAGALQTGFGRQGTVNWDSTIYSANFTAVSGVGYFCDTSSAAFTVTLPANPSIGDIVAVKDWSSTAATNNITIARNGQEIEGNTTDGLINVHGDAQTLVFSGTSRGWMVVNSGLLEGIQGPQFIIATGGTETFCGNCKVHTFTGPGTFTVTCAGNDLGSNSVNYLVIAGGAAGGSKFSRTNLENGAGGGAGGFRQNFPSPSTTGLPVTTTSYPITVGGGGAVAPSAPVFAGSGNPSTFSTITSAGGGGGGGCGAGSNGASGGSGGGAAGWTGGSPPANPGGAGNTPPVSPPQGNPGGPALSIPADQNNAGSGGGGSSAAGQTVVNTTTGGNGGAGTATSITGPSVTYAGGGAGMGGSGGTGGSGGGGPGGQTGTAGTANTGGGGGGGGNNSPSFPKQGGAGGSGIVVIRYKYQ